MQNITESEALFLLKKYSPDERVFNIILAHSRAVQAVALRITQEIVDNGYDADIEFIRTASLLHDIGRFFCPPKGKESILHGVKGAEILQKEGLDKRYCLACERHIGPGIDLYDIEHGKLNLPKKNYIPETMEEKIICYADKLIEGDREAGIEKEIQRYRKELSERVAQRLISLHNEIEILRKKR